jgi:hypothetical protein
VFVGVVTESETYHIFEPVLETIKVATHNLFEELNFTAKLDVGLLLFEMP